MSGVISVQGSTESPYKHTRHDTAIETLLTDSDDDILAMTFQNLRTRNHKTIGTGVRVVEPVDAGVFALGLVPERDAFIIVDLLDGVGLSRSAGLVALDVAPGNEDTVTGDYLVGLEECDITDEQFFDTNDAPSARADNFDKSILLPFVEDTELSFHFPIFEGANHHLWKEGEYAIGRVTIIRHIP